MSLKVKPLLYVYYTICPTTSVLAAESGGFGHCFMLPRLLAKPARLSRFKTPTPQQPLYCHSRKLLLSILNHLANPGRILIPNPGVQDELYQSWQALPGCALTAICDV